MRKLLLSFSLAALTFSGFAQIKSPVEWSYKALKINATSLEIHLTANIAEEWHVYSQNTPDGGPIPTAIMFTKNPLLTAVGDITEVGKLQEHFEQLFGVNVKQFSHKVDFVQKFSIRPGVKTSVMGTIKFMTCNDHECMPPKTESFNIHVE